MNDSMTTTASAERRAHKMTELSWAELVSEPAEPEPSVWSTKGVGRGVGRGVGADVGGTALC